MRDSSRHRFLRKEPFFRELQKKYPFDRGCGYFYDGDCSSLLEECLSSRVGLPRLVAQSVAILRDAGRGEIIAFNDEIAGWRSLTSSRKYSPVVLRDAGDLPAFVGRCTFFRDPNGKRDNYYFTTSLLDAFVVFCHEDDWHA